MLSMSLVGSYVALSKQLLPSFPPFALAWVRFIIAAIFMVPWLLEWRGRWRSVSRLDALVLFGMSFFGNFLFTMFMLFGVAHTSVAAAGIIMSLLPATIAVLSVVILRERLTVPIGLALLLAIVGVAALSVQKDSVGSSLLGNSLMVGALLCEALYVIGAKYLTDGFSPKQIAVSMNTTGLILTTPLGLYQSTQVDWGSVSFGAWALLVFYAVSASQIAPWLWFRGLKSIPASRAGVMTVALPLTAAALGIYLFGETWTVWHTFAFVCALFGVVLVTVTGQKKNG
ncbi:membrane protein [Formosimonas limnophila]|uniref:Membrane protein n=2 Tax=Formosimonas limnophila TaxID=1384487 RepID=A0A8J3CN24_9BURK|nr:membrane protein [Formosimonas limnophila]